MFSLLNCDILKTMPELSYFMVFTIQVLVFSSIYFAILRISPKWLTSKVYFLSALSVILGLQIFLASRLQHQVGDVMLFEGAGYYYRYHTDFYFIDADHSQYPFFPLLIFLHAVLNKIVVATGQFNFSFYLKVCMTPLLLFLGYKSVSVNQALDKTADRILPPLKSWQRQELLLFLTHPITTMVVYFHGQVDVFLLFFLVWGWWALFHPSRQWRYWLLGAGLMALSIASKTWSVLVLPYAFLLERDWLKRLGLPVMILGGLGSLIFLYTRTVFGSSFRTVLAAVSQAGGPMEIWGVTVLLPPLAQLNPQLLTYGYLGLVGLISILVWYKHHSGWRSIFLIILGAVLISPRFGIQYLFWFVPLVYAAGLAKQRHFFVFTCLGALYAYGNYLNTREGMKLVSPELLEVLGLAVWLHLTYWWQQLFRAVQYTDKPE